MSAVSLNCSSGTHVATGFMAMDISFTQSRPAAARLGGSMRLPVRPTAAHPAGVKLSSQARAFCNNPLILLQAYSPDS